MSNEPTTTESAVTGSVAPESDIETTATATPLDIDWDLGPDEDLSFDCPRCRQATTAHHYGPCGTCRSQLRAELSGEARDVEAADYEPKMNVTPNAIATKD